MQKYHIEQFIPCAMPGQVVDHFTPSNEDILDDDDLDFGSAALIFYSCKCKPPLQLLQIKGSLTVCKPFRAPVLFASMQ